jgi:DNA-binding transcriptional LysR family regulator
MYFREIEAFLAVASCHSISGAADLLNVTQSAVSHRIRKLESHLGSILIDRMKGSRRCDLTLSGEAFLPTAEIWSQAWRETQKLKLGASALSLDIGCVDSVNTFLLPQTYRELITHKPPVHLRIYTMRSDELYEKVERRELDAAFVLQEQRHQNVDVKPFYCEPMRIVRLRQRKNESDRIDAKDLDPAFELFINWGPWYQIWHDSVWSSYRKAQIELDTVTLIQALMQHPRQWAVVPFSVLSFFRRDKRIAVQELIPKPPDRITHLITHRFRRLASRQAIEILELIAREKGFLKSYNANGHDGKQTCF